MPIPDLTDTLTLRVGACRRRAGVHSAPMSGEWWGFIFLMLVMKVPIVYLAGVVWYACKPPDPPELSAPGR